MTIAEKKLELVQHLLVEQDRTVLFEIEKLLGSAYKKATGWDSIPAASEVDFGTWAAQFEESETDEETDEFGLTTTQFRQQIWQAERSPEMSLNEFFARIEN